MLAEVALAQHSRVIKSKRAILDHVEFQPVSTLDDAGRQLELPSWQAQTWQAGTSANALADRFLHFVLYITILSSFYVIIEPAPFEYLAAVLGFACVLARVSLNRVVLPLLILLLIRDAGGVAGLLAILDTGWMRLAGDPVALSESTFDYPDSIRFLGISFYLGLTGVMFACLLTQDTMRRIATLRSAYVMAAVVASLLGTAGYFQLYPGLDVFTWSGRAAGGFKGPNDLGSYLIPPLMWLIQGFIVDKIRLRDLVASAIIFVGLLLSFSRGAWGCSVFSAVFMIYFLFITQTDRRSRNRLIFFVAGGIVAAVAIFAVLSSIGGVSEMLAQRTQLQDYDVNADNRSRLMLQQDSLRAIFDHPLGMGPWGFAHATDWVSHNTYLGITLNHGWVGGAAYLTLVVLTLIVGFRTLWLRTPWQPFLIAAYASFLAMMAEGLWGDTDHWRHFYIVLGVVWGLAAASQKVIWRKRANDLLDQNNLLMPSMRG